MEQYFIGKLRDHKSYEELKKMEKITISKDFTETPGGRYICEGPFSGEEFRENILKQKYEECRNKKNKLLVDLDGGYGYATSFLEESFGGLARIYEPSEILETLVIKSNDEEELVDEISKYIREGRVKEKGMD